MMSTPSISLPHFLPSEAWKTELRHRIRNFGPHGPGLALVALDFDNFNYVNDLFGYEVGDRTLARLFAHFSTCLHEGEIFSHLHSDHFVFALTSQKTADLHERLLQMTQLNKPLAGILPAHYRLLASGGIVQTSDNRADLTTLMDEANYARKLSKGNSVHSFSFFDAQLREEVKWRKIVTCSMDLALRKREFEMYLQPKIHLSSNKVVGAEALVRWNSPQHGLVFPDRFIPILEQSGLICQLDFYMLEEACRFLQHCKAQSMPQMPISVNFSRAHLVNCDLVADIFHTVNQAGISPHMIEIEFTESLSIRGFADLGNVLSKLRLLGFRVSLDDFGNAYSSLNCLKDLHFDLIKIDKGFLSNNDDSERGRLIITKVVELISSLHLPAVMEGIETSAHLQFLQQISCEIGQGYFYARPMPSADYLRYLESNRALPQEQVSTSSVREKVPSANIAHPLALDAAELFTLVNNIDMGLIKGYLDGTNSVQYINDRALDYLGYTRQEFLEIFHNGIGAFTHPDDAQILQDNARKLRQSSEPLHFRTRAVRKDGKIVYLQGSASSMMDAQGRPVALYAFQDVTQELEEHEQLQHSLEDKVMELQAMFESERRSKEALRQSEERYRVIFDQNNDIMFEWNFERDIITFSERYQELFGLLPLCDRVSSNPEIRERVHPDDLPAFELWVKQTYRKPGYSEGEYRLCTAEGDYIWVCCRSTALQGTDGSLPRTIGVFSNISQQRRAMELLAQKSKLDPLTQVLNKAETQLQINTHLLENPEEAGALLIIDIDNFKGLNDNLGHQMGDAVLLSFAEQLRSALGPRSIIGRIGGDEFAAYLCESEHDEVLAQAQALCVSLRSTYYGSTSQYYISASIGAAHFPQHGSDYETLYRLADAALYASKRLGKDRLSLYSSDMNSTLIDNRTPVDLSDGFLSAYFKQDFPFQVFQILYETRDVHVCVQMILQLLGKRYSVDRAYIFQVDEAQRSISNSFEWCAPGIPPEMHNLQNLPEEVLVPYREHYNLEGVFSCPDVRQSSQLIYDLCHPQGIKSLLHSAFYNDRMISGFIGFDSCTDYRTWSGEEIATLCYVSRILSVFLSKSGTESQLRTSYDNYVSMLDNLNGYVYVVDPQTHEVLYINNATRALGCTTGQRCYTMAFGADAPCSNCPVKQFSQTQHYASAEIYSELLQVWVHSSASKLIWGGTREAALICCTDISKYKTDPSPRSDAVPKN